jgi:large subunit ribosomal protein L33
MAANIRSIIQLECTDCKNRNYSTTKNKRTMPDKLQMKKFCPFCRKHTGHKETK